jgi:hypothetical protein
MNPDAYPLPKQDDILGAMGGAQVFSILDMAKSFYQQKIVPEDRNWIVYSNSDFVGNTSRLAIPC